MLKSECSDNMAKWKECLVHWKKKLERTSDEDVIIDTIRKLQKVPITVELLQETGIGKIIRTLGKQSGKVGEKASIVLMKWREVVSGSQKAPEKTSKEVPSNKKHHSNKEPFSDKSQYKPLSNNREDQIKCASKYGHQNKSREPKNVICESPADSCDDSESDHERKHSSPPSYTYNKEQSPAKYVAYDLNSEVNVGYSPDHPELYPGKSKQFYNEKSERATGKRRNEQMESIDMMEGMFRTKKIKHESQPSASSNSSQDRQNGHFEKDYKKISNKAVDISLHKEREKEKKKKVCTDSSKKIKEKVDKSHFMTADSEKYSSKLSSVKHADNDSLHTPKQTQKTIVKDSVMPKSQKHHSDTVHEASKKKSVSSSSGKDKLKIAPAEEFTASEVSFEDCLGFNDIVTSKKKKSVVKSSNSEKLPKKTKSSSKSPLESSHSSKEKLDVKQHSKQKKSTSLKIPKALIEAPKHLKLLDDVDIVSTLPEIQPNYRPLPHRDLDGYLNKKKVLSNEEAILFTSSRKEKTAVYSGRKTCFLTEVPTLFESCTRVLIENIDAIEYMGEVPYFILKPVIERCTPLQLYTLEDYNAYLLENTHELWEEHCKRNFRSRKPEENETWREMYWRVYDEREKKLKSITANISASMSKYNPARQVKLTYIDSVAKPPRDVARRQAKNGTGLPVNHHVKTGTPSKSTPRPVAPVINSVAACSSSAPFIPKKPKIAPLMAKTLKSMKQCYRRN